MEWEGITARAGSLAVGEFYVYLVVIDPDAPAVVLSRVHKGHLFGWQDNGVALPLFAVAHAAAHAVRFPVGPGGQPELTALLESAKARAEKYEAARHGPAPLAWHTGEFVRPLTLEGSDGCASC